MAEQQLPFWRPGDPVQLLVYGEPKAGKTFGSGTFPRPCYLDFDQGIKTIYSTDFMKKHGYRKVLWKEFYERSFQGPVILAHNAYDDACRYFDEMMKRQTEFDTWIIDSGTTLSEDAQNKGVILLGTKDYNFMSATHKEALKHKLLVPKIQDYGAERSLVEQFIDMVKASKKNLVLICHEYEVTDEKGNRVGVLPLLTGKSRQAVPLKFDEVYHVRMRRQGEEWQNICKTKADGVYLVGSRNGVADDIEWTYDSVLKGLTDAHNERQAFITAAETAGDPVKSSAA